MVFDWPETARFLTPEERIRARQRLNEDDQASTEETYDKNYIIAAAKDWKTWAYAWIYIGALIPLYSFSLFVPTILGGMGYEGTTAQLLSVPPYAVAACNVIFIGWLGDRYKKRGILNMITLVIGITGFIMLIASPSQRVQYAGLFLGAMGIYPIIPNTIAWVANNVEGVYKRGVVIGTVVGTGNLHGVVSSNIYLSEEEPRFWTGHGVVLAAQFLCALCGTILVYIMLKIENRKRRNGERDDMHAGKSEYEIQVMGDKRPDFIYTT